MLFPLASYKALGDVGQYLGMTFMQLSACDGRLILMNGASRF